MIFVYPYLRGADDWDIIHSIKFVRRSFPSAHIVTVGDKVHEADENIPHLKRYNNRGSDVTDKILTFCKVNPGSEFIYMNDDFFIFKNFIPDKYLHNGPITINPNHAPHYQLACMNTMEFLKHNDFSFLSFECHQPILFKADPLKQLMNEVNWKDHNHFIKSLYCNIYDLPSVTAHNLKLNEANLFLASKFADEWGSFSIGEGFKSPKGVEFIRKLIASPA